MEQFMERPWALARMHEVRWVIHRRIHAEPGCAWVCTSVNPPGDLDRWRLQPVDAAARHFDRPPL
ncbi:MAG: hypothetical protein IPI02_18550 [Sterolibacteriaceae bacterium]|nr:hypothetical protein [Sterolibacteriaceae bacterium]